MRTLGPQPLFQIRQKWRTLLLPDPPTLLGAQAVDRALDLEQRVDALDRLQGNRRDRRRLPAAPGIGRNVGELEELPSGVSPAQGRCDWSLRTGGIIEAVVATVGIGLQDAAKALKMPGRMLVPASAWARAATASA